MRAAPVEWERFLHGGCLQDAYNVPDSTAMLLERLDENVVTYLVCHPRTAFRVLMHCLCKKYAIQDMCAPLH
jgi:hypothetical protein